MKRILLFFIILFLEASSIWSQCVSTCSAYAVSPITFSAFASNGPTLNSLFTPSADDGTVSVPIGFSFDFYCNSYSTIIVCTNGFMQFDYGTPLGFGSPPYSHAPQSFPSTYTPNGLVALQMNDFDVTTSGSISYTTVGSSPYRQFILTYSDVPIWYDAAHNIPPSPLYNSGQIVLYETTNIIEIHTANIPISPYLGTQGIENTTGTLGATSPGRNFAAWSGTNSAYQFSPFTPGPPLTVTGSTFLCQGTYDFYQASYIVGATAYNWSFPPGWTGSSSLTLITATAGSSGALSVTATYTCGTSAPTILNISVTPSPTVSISASPVIMCSGKTVTLSTTGAQSYTINPGNLMGSSSFTDMPPTTTIYSVSGTNSLGCESFITTTVSVYVKLTPTVSVDNGSVCLGGTFDMNPNSSATSYSVLGGSGNFSSVTPTLAGLYSYTVIGNGGNGCIADPVVSTLTVYALPHVGVISSHSIICNKESAVLTATGANTYAWTNLSTNASITVSPTANSYYSVTGMNNYGCKNTATYTIVVNPCTGIEQNDQDNLQIKIYPNPTNGLFDVVFNPSDNGTLMEIYSTVGQLLKSVIVTGQTTRIDIQEYTPGLYYVKIKNNGYEKIIKMLKN